MLHQQKKTRIVQDLCKIVLCLEVAACWPKRLSVRLICLRLGQTNQLYSPVVALSKSAPVGHSSGRQFCFLGYYVQD